MISKTDFLQAAFYSVPILGLIPKNIWKKGLDSNALQALALLIVGIGGGLMVVKGCQLKKKKIEPLHQKKSSKFSNQENPSTKKFLLIGGGLVCLALGYYLAYEMSASIAEEGICLQEDMNPKEEACLEALQRIENDIASCPDVKSLFDRVQNKASFAFTCAEENQASLLVSPQPVPLSKRDRNSFYLWIIKLVEREKKAELSVEERLKPYCPQGKDEVVNAIMQTAYDSFLKAYKIYNFCVNAQFWKVDANSETLFEKLNTFEKYEIAARKNVVNMNVMLDIYHSLCES